MRFVQISKRSANWFYWIVVLSVVNSVASVLHFSYHFVVGLGATQVIDLMIDYTKKGIVIGIMLFIECLVLGVYALMGFLANKRLTWAFVTGSVLYILDALLCVAAKEWLSVGFHLLVLYYLYQGFKANSMLRRLDVPASPSVPPVTMPMFTPTIPPPPYNPPPVQSSIAMNAPEQVATPSGETGNPPESTPNI